MKVAPVDEDVSEAFVEDLLRPACPNQPLRGEPKEKVSKRRGLEDAGVVDDHEGHGLDQYPRPSFWASPVNSSRAAFRSASSACR